MALILCIETSSVNCSVALSDNGKVLALKESSEGYAHSEKLHPFIDEVLKEASMPADNLDAVMVGSGPGSFTGLRIGVAAAKGLCFALSIPLMSYTSLDNMASRVFDENSPQHYCALIDARRMEAYCAFYDDKLNQIGNTEAVIMDERTFLDKLADNEVLFFGDGMNKIRDLYSENSNAGFTDNILPSASALCEVAEMKFAKEEFEDVAYFEPFYLKSFQPTTPRKKV